MIVEVDLNTTFTPLWMTLELLKSNFSRSESFNIFQDLKTEKILESPLRAPNQPEKNPPEPEKISIYEEKISIYEVEIPDFEQNIRRDTPCLGLSPLRQDKDTTFFAEIQIALIQVSHVA